MLSENDEVIQLERFT